MLFFRFESVRSRFELRPLSCQLTRLRLLRLLELHPPFVALELAASHEYEAADSNAQDVAWKLEQDNARLREAVDTLEKAASEDKAGPRRTRDGLLPGVGVTGELDNAAGASGARLGNVAVGVDGSSDDGARTAVLEREKGQLVEVRGGRVKCRHRNVVQSIWPMQIKLSYGLSIPALSFRCVGGFLLRDFPSHGGLEDAPDLSCIALSLFLNEGLPHIAETTVILGLV